MVSMTQNNKTRIWLSESNQKNLLLTCLAVCLILPFAMVDAQQSGATNVIAEIQKALAGQKELSQVLSYLNMSQKELVQALTTSQTGTVKSYTFFAPTNWAFLSMLPQDIADPFFVDTELRQTVLLHHFVHGALTKEDLLNSAELVMADKKSSQLTRIAASESVKINKANINLKSIPIGSNFGVIYIVDKVFTTTQEIEKAISRHPAVETPWGPIDSNANSGQQNVESQTVVVDLVAEFLREEAAAAEVGQP